MSDASDGLQSVTPLGGLALPSGGAGVARLGEARTLARLALRADAEASRRIEAALGLGLGRPINRASVTETCVTLRLGPDEWLILADPERDPWLVAHIADAAGDMALSLVDVTHRHAGLVVEGPDVEAVLAAGCALPLDGSAFPIGRATRTLLAKTEVVLWREAAQRFHLEVARSFVPYVVGILAGSIADVTAIARSRRA